MAPLWRHCCFVVSVKVRSHLASPYQLSFALGSCQLLPCPRSIFKCDNATAALAGLGVPRYETSIEKRGWSGGHAALSGGLHPHSALGSP